MVIKVMKWYDLDEYIDLPIMMIHRASTKRGVAGCILINYCA